MTNRPETAQSLRSRIAGLLDRLRALADPSGGGGDLLAVLSEARTSGEFGAIKDRLRGLAEIIEELQAQLEDALRQAEQAERLQQQRIGDSEEFVTDLKLGLREASGRSPDEAVALWLRAFAEALAAWNLDLCERLTGDEFLHSQELGQLPATLSRLITALRSDDRAAALPGLELLVNGSPAGLPQSPIDAASRAALLLVLGRIRLRDARDDVGALECFERAREASPADGRVYAALAEYHRAKQDEARVRDLYRQAIAASPDRPSGYVGMGLWCEAQEWWDEAQAWYSQAVEVVLLRAASGDPLAELSQLLAPVSGALYLRLAQAIGTVNPALGLAAVDQAIELGVIGEGKHPERAAHQLKGEMLEALQRPREAADAFFQAGQYNSWDDNPDVACKLHERAYELDPQLYRNYWSWADALLVMSYMSEPPYVDPDRISESLDVWNRGATIRPPDEDYYWAYLTRARIAERLSYLAEAGDRWEHHWEAMSFAEQSLQLNPTRTLAWVMLGAIHYAVGNYVNAEHATETALLCEPEDVSAIDERIILLTNLDRYAEARALLAKRSTLGPQDAGWLKAIEAHIALYESLRDTNAQNYEAGLAASDIARSSGWDATWSTIDRARLLRLVGRTDEARQQYEELWREFDERDVDNQVPYAWAALMTDEYDAALGVLTPCSSERIAGLTTVQRYLGFCRLLRGELEPAREHFARALDLANSAVELDAWLIGDIECAEVLQRLAGRPNEQAAREMLDQAKGSALKRRATLQLPSSPLQEVEQLVAELEERGETVGWSWIGAHATAARLNLEAHRWNEASELYRKLQDHPGRFFTAQRGLEQALYGLFVEEQGTAATRGLTTGGSGLPEDLTQLAASHDKRADLERRRRPTRLFGQTGMERFPAVTPILIETAENLAPLLQSDDGDFDPDFARHLRAMRSGLKNLLGFTTPAVRIRVNRSDFPDGTYVLALNEIPLVSGNIDPNQGLCNETVEQLRLLDVKAEQAVHPATGSECSWVGRGDWQKVQDAGLVLWTPAEYVVLHLSGVLRKSSVELVGIQAVAELLHERAAEQHSRIVAAEGGLARFTKVIQALLAEGVPIKELPSICDCYLAHLSLPTYEIPEEIRRLETVRKGILGNTSDTPVYRLGEKLTALLVEGITRDGEAAVLALEPEPIQEALAAVRYEVSNSRPTTVKPVILVEDWRIRPFVRTLIELEFPFLPVLSRREAMAPDTRPALATIELE